MEDMFFSHFNSILGDAPARDFSIDLAVVGISSLDLSQLDTPFTEEIVAAIKSMPLNRALSPDGFTTEFYRVAWPTIKTDMVSAIYAFVAGDSRDLAHLNNAFITLLTKKDGASSLSDFHPISLIHSVGKLITKALALRLALWLNLIVTTSQSAFISGRSIHDSFKLVHSTATLLKRTKKAKILLKLDISRPLIPLDGPSYWRCLGHGGSASVGAIGSRQSCAPQHPNPPQFSSRSYSFRHQKTEARVFSLSFPVRDDHGHS